MSLFRLLFLLFLLVPVVEIYFLITVGSVIGAWPTVLLVIATAVIGAFLVRQQGISTLFRFQHQLRATRTEYPYQDRLESEAAAITVIEGILILVSGILLLTPGFLTDAVGFICLVPPWRLRLIRRFFRHNLPGGGSVYTVSRTSGGRIIEGNFRREDPED
uniref:UPF0716 protein FxsA n=1 Tax=Candidatus Kentrum sp. DK TaxID=2126562 RepID=A0A450S6Y7_9GAMM|nr:MAG: UPF0716 protein FxsA [Candidatus Kentron sp. DK]VFJ47639.1 MAG: UPF0716 protein FxsA [Candidatus Kentron sp. DK]